MVQLFIGNPFQSYGASRAIWDHTVLPMAGSSMRLVRLKLQGLGPDRGPDRPVQKKF